MSEERRQRVAEEIKQEVGRIIQEKLKDPRIGFVTITRIDLSADLHFAKIYFGLLGSEREKRSTQAGLANSVKFIRKLLGERLKLRYIPEIAFQLDKNIEYSIHLSQVLERIKKEGKKSERRTDNQGN